MGMRPQSTIGQQMRPPEARPRYGTVVSIGATTVYVVIDGGGLPVRMAAVGGAPRVNQRVEVTESAGIFTARIPS